MLLYLRMYVQIEHLIPMQSCFIGNETRNSHNDVQISKHDKLNYIDFALRGAISVALTESGEKTIHFE